MAYVLAKKTFLNAYAKLTDADGSSSITCLPIGQVNPETLSQAKATAITDALANCLNQSASSTNPAAQIIAVKSVQAYNLENVSS